MAPATNLDGGGVDEVDLGRAKLTAATAQDGGESSGDERRPESGKKRRQGVARRGDDGELGRGRRNGEKVRGDAGDA
jgi:Domain of unknown function (DUF834).